MNVTEARLFKAETRERKADGSGGVRAADWDLPSPPSHDSPPRGSP
jgi:hypothetical protein